MIIIGFYREHYKKALLNLWKHPILLVPDIVYAFLALGGGIALVQGLGIFSLVKEMAAIEETQRAFSLLYTFLGENLIKLVVSVLLFFLVLFVTGATATATKLAMIRSMLKNKEPSLKEGFQASRKYFWKIIGVRILTFLLYGATLLAGLLMAGVMLPLHKPTGILMGIAVMGILSGVLFLSFFFRFPLLYEKNLSAAQTLKESYDFFKANKRFTIMVAVILAITVAVIRQFLSVVGTLLTSPSPFFIAIAGVVSIWISLFTLVYTFQAFEHVKAKK